MSMSGHFQIQAGCRMPRRGFKICRRSSCDAASSVSVCRKYITPILMPWLLLLQGKKWSTGSRNFAANFVDECSVSAKKQAKARDDFHKKTSLTEFLQTVQKKQIASYLLRRDVAIDKLSPNDQVTVLKLVWTEPGAAECSHPWQVYKCRSTFLFAAEYLFAR